MLEHRRLPAVATWLAVLALGATALAAQTATKKSGPPKATPPASAPAPVSPPAIAGASPAKPDGAAGIERLHVYAYTLRYRRLDEAVLLVRGLLSTNGTIEVQGETNTLVLRDSLSALARAVPVLRRFDHPPRPVTIDLQLLRAGTTAVSPPQGDVKGPIVEKLRKMFRYDSYTEIARSTLKAEEGAEVTYEMTGGYRVEFQLGTILDESRIRLHGFRILRLAGSEQELVHTEIPLLWDQAFAMGLARDEASPNALFVVLTYQRPGAP
jgi:hypothetical protein